MSIFKNPGFLLTGVDLEISHGNIIRFRCRKDIYDALVELLESVLQPKLVSAVIKAIKLERA